MNIEKGRPAGGGPPDPQPTDRLHFNGRPIGPLAAVVTVFPETRGGRAGSFVNAVTKGLLPAGLQTEISGPAPDKPPGRRSCQKCGRTDRRFSGRHVLCNVCRTSAQPARWCECGALLGPRRQKCDQCRMAGHPASSHCAFCGQLYWTHRGLAEDLPAMRYHVAAQCIKRSDSRGVHVRGLSDA
jgi:hypothetical protein